MAVCGRSPSSGTCWCEGNRWDCGGCTGLGDGEATDDGAAKLWKVGEERGADQDVLVCCVAGEFGVDVCSGLMWLQI